MADVEQYSLNRNTLHESGVRTGWLTSAFVLQTVVLLALLGIYYKEVWQRLIHIWSVDSDWSHGFIIPLFGLYFLYLQRDRMPLGVTVHRGASRVAGVILLTAGFVLYMYCLQRQIEYLKTISLVISIMGVVVLSCGWPVARWSWFAIAFLVFAMPLPVRLYEQLTMPLREIAAIVSAFVLSCVPDMEAEASGTIVNTIYQGKAGPPLDIERACSGMRLLITMTALGVAMAFIHRRPIWQRMVMIIACVPIAIFCNFIRVTTTGFLVVFEKAELARGMWHTLLGICMLFLAFSLYGGISFVLSHLYVDSDGADGDLDESTSMTVGGSAE